MEIKQSLMRDPPRSTWPMHLSTQRTPLDTPRVAGAGGGADMAHRADRGPGRQGRACGHRPWRWAAVGWPGVRTGRVGTGSAGSGRPTTPQPYRCVVACFSGQKVKAEETHCVCLRGDGGPSAGRGARAGATFKEGVPTSYPRGQADMGRAGCTQDAHLAGGCLPPEAQDRARAPSGEGRRG